MQRKSIARIWPLALIALAVFALALGGCGKKDEAVETDPGAGGAGDNQELENVELQEDTGFGGADAGAEDVEGEDLGAAEEVPAILLQDVFFDYDKFDLSDEARSALNQNGRLLKENDGARILIEGHCDERGTVQYNLALGEKRAREVKAYLIDLGISAARVDVVSYGKEKPFVLGHDESSWAQNRRAHFVVR